MPLVYGMAHQIHLTEITTMNGIFSELGLVDGHEIYVVDPTSPNSLTFKLQLASKIDH